MINKAVEQKVKEMFKDGSYATEADVSRIAKEISKDLYEKFEVELKNLNEEILKLSERSNRLWDIVTSPSQPKRSYFAWLKKLAFWKS